MKAWAGVDLAGIAILVLEGYVVVQACHLRRVKGSPRTKTSRAPPQWRSAERIDLLKAQYPHA